MSYLIYDLVILAVLALFVWRGASRGLVLSFLGLIAVSAATAGAALASRTLAPQVSSALEPKFAAVIEEKLEEELHASGLDRVEQLPLQDVLAVLKEIGFYEDIVDTVSQAIQSGMIPAAANAAATVAAAAAQKAASCLIFSVVFSLLMAVWTFLRRILRRAARLPGVRLLNKTGGAALGLIKGCILLFIAAWILRFLGNLIPENAVQQTYLLRFFMTTNPVALLLGR